MRALVLILGTSLLAHAAVWDLELCKNREKHWVGKTLIVGSEMSSRNANVRLLFRPV